MIRFDLALRCSETEDGLSASYDKSSILGRREIIMSRINMCSGACLFLICIIISSPAQQAGPNGTANQNPKPDFRAAPRSENTNAQPDPTPQAATYPISCSSGTACKKTYIPLFATNGGAANVQDSIMLESGSTIELSGDLSATSSLSAVTGTMTGAANGIAAVTGAATATGNSGFTFGVLGTSASDTGRAVVGLAIGTKAVGVIGENSVSGFGVVGKALGTTGTGVYGQGPDYAFQAVGNAQQNRTGGGWVKAMVFVNAQDAPYTIVKCFNSTLAGTAATTPPCGFGLDEISQNIFNVDFNFEIDDRFLAATPTYGTMTAVPITNYAQVRISAANYFYLIVF